MTMRDPMRAGLVLGLSTLLNMDLCQLSFTYMIVHSN
jgi:hypothetical protein